MNKLTRWLKEDRRYVMFIKIACAFLLPFAVCMLHCILKGAWLGDVSLAGSQNNDDLFYFKQVEGILEYGFPQGYFGFNESHAEHLSFAAWSPLTLIVWVIWGRIFGWSISNYFWCNLVFHGLALAFFTWVTKPNVKQMVAAGVLLALFPGFAKYSLSCLVETHMISWMIIFYGLAVGYAKEQKNWKLTAMFLLGIFLTCIRPYLVLLILLPGIYLFMKKKLLALGVTGAAGVVGIVAYFGISAAFTAEYFTPLFDKYLFRRFIDESFYAGARYIAVQTLKCAGDLLTYIKLSFTEGKFMGMNYSVLFLLCAIFIVMCIFYIKDKKKEFAVLYGHFVGTAFISVTALLVIMGKMNEGSRHILAFIVVGLILVSFMGNFKQIWRPVLVCALIGFLFYYYPDDGKDYQIPLRSEESVALQDAWEEIGQKIVFTEDAPSYENTVLWAFSDSINGNYDHMDWHPLLALPGGTGISCCQWEYISPNMENLQSRYIMADKDGELVRYCDEAGYELLGEYENVRLYRRN
ncbi:MAG: hypothetical protein IJ291_00845 [Lachnospiraceae bacterium]|nr:hypothetical protein [Lachnospiraceae bacterium]